MGRAAAPSPAVRHRWGHGVAPTDLQGVSALPSEAAIQCMLAVGRLKSFTKAADELFMTRQAVSRQIAHLEKELGAQLFLRTTARVELTAVGEVYWNAFCQMQAQWEETRRKAEVILSGQGARIYIGCNHDLDLGEWVLRVIESCRRRGYDLSVDWERREPHDLLEPLLAGRLDVVFSFGQTLTELKQADELDHIPIAQGHAVLVIREDHPLVRPGMTARDLQDVPCFIAERMTPFGQDRAAFRAEWAAYGIDLGDIHVVSNRESAQTMVELGQGVTIAMDVDRLPHQPHMLTFPLDRSQSVECIWRKGERRPQMRAFLQAVRESLHQP